MSTRNSASLDGSLLARKGDAAPAIPEERPLTDQPGRPSVEEPSPAPRFAPLTTSRHGLIALVSVALVGIALIAAGQLWAPPEPVVLMAEVSSPAATSVPDVPEPVVDAEPPAMPAPLPVMPAAEDTATPPAPEPVGDGVVRAAVVSDAPPPKKPVRQQVRAAAPVTAGPYGLQLAAFSNANAAQGEAARLQKRLDPVLGSRKVVVVEASDADAKPVWRLRASGYSTLADARAACERIRALKTGCWVIRR